MSVEEAGSFARTVSPPEQETLGAVDVLGILVAKDADESNIVELA